MGLLLRVLIFAAAILAVLYWWRSFIASHRVGTKAQKQGIKKQKKMVADQQNMTSCLYCGVFIPEGEAVYGKKGSYCSHKHHALGEK